MTAREYLISEVEWLLAANMHPAHVAKALNLSLYALERRLYRYGRNDLARPFRNELNAQKREAA